MKKLIALLLCWLVASYILYSQELIQYHFEADKTRSLSKYLDVTPYYNPELDNYDITFYHLDIEVSPKSTNVSGNTKIIAISKKDDLNEIVLELKQNMNIDSILLDGMAVTYDHSSDEIMINTTSAIDLNQSFEIIVYYHGTAMGDGVTHAEIETYGGEVTWTLSESFHAYDWFPCKQVLSDKADSAYIFLTTDAIYKAGSNGILTNTIELDNNKMQYQWKTRHPINFYLISYAVANYQDYSYYAHIDGVDPVLIQNFIYNHPEILENYKENLDVTADFLNLYTELFGMYPYYDEKYGHCQAELGGAMEHQTMTTTGSFSYTIIAHEAAHQWFGDLVTCASWQDIWINEGFASYAEYIALEHLTEEQYYTEWMDYAIERALLEQTGSVYIPFEDAGNEYRIFNWNLSYKKGAVLVHMIRNEINNDDLFYSICKSFLDEYSDSVATGDDFLSTMNLASREDYSDFFNDWYYGEGFPTFDIEWKHKRDTLYITSEQQTSSSNTPLFRMHVPIRIISPDGNEDIRIYQDDNSCSFAIPFTKNIWELQVDPENWILNQPGNITNVENISDLQYSVYPSPLQDILHIKLSNPTNEIIQVEIINLNGQTIYSSWYDQDQIQINSSNWAKGVYFIKIIKEKEQMIKKILKI